MHRRAVLVSLALTLLPFVSSAQDITYGGKDIAEAKAGTYEIDPDHAAVIARVSHLRYSYSVFRFDKLGGTLTWDPANVAKSSLTATVQTNSITSNVKGFAETLTGVQFLKAAEFPQATFVSTAFRPTDATHGKVEGQFNLMGATKPVTFDVELVGAGKGFEGRPRMGVHARATIYPQDYGFMPLFSDPVELLIDAEFVRKP
jgi:polyisoprenoid-binding protein YceI